MPAKKPKKRCKWAESNELLAAYHDMEWGIPVYDDRLLFEMLNLEGAQAGLSWLTILKKRVFLLFAVCQRTNARCDIGHDFNSSTVSCPR